MPRTRNALTRRTPRAFTLIELAVVNVVIVAVLALLQPAVGKARGSSRDITSQQNMALLGRGGMLYAGDNEGQVHSLNPSISAGQGQAIEIISRLTGRTVGGTSQDALLRLNSIIPHRRYQHLVLMAYFDLPLPLASSASPFDRNLLQWQQDPFASQQATVPYAAGPAPAGYDQSSNWPNQDVRQLWPYASSYQTVPAAWNPNNNDGARKTWNPVAETPHLFSSTFTASTGQQRFYSEVRFPSQKVFQFEEFDRVSDPNGLWFAYPNARCNLLFFDGSVRNLATSEANPGWNPAAPAAPWEQRYVPLDTFPYYADGFGLNQTLPMRYRWTRQGLGGLDYGLRELGDGFSKINE